MGYQYFQITTFAANCIAITDYFNILASIN